MAKKKPDPRDAGGRTVKWGSLYKKHFPHNTDPFSRHVKVISQGLREKRSPLRKLLDDAGYDPDHMAHSMEVTVKLLWEARAELNRPTPPMGK